jgi:VanZ family protein
MRPVARLALLLTIAYAISDEAHQTFIAGRHGALVDVLIDSAAPSLLWLYYEKSAQHGHNTSA